MAGTQAQAEILGQLLVIQQTLDVMSNIQGLASFLNEALQRVPGVAAVHLCVEGELIPPDDEIARFCAQCGKTSHQHMISSVPTCGAASGFSALELRTARHHYGFLILTIAEPQSIDPYWAFLENIANSVAQTLEIREYIEKINQTNAVLEQHVIDKTRELTLSQTELQRFAEISAHHLQEPARRLVSYARRLRFRLGDRLDDEEDLQALIYIEQSSVRMLDLVQDIEHYLSAGLPRGPVVMQNTASILADLTRRLAPRLTAANATLETETLPSVLLDKPRYINLLEILLDNALTHRRPGTQTHIRVSGGQREAKTFLRVEDNGPGIPEEYRQRVFEVFERLATKPEGGTGIGLAIARRIVESLGGKIAIEPSTLGGAAVVIELPATQRAA